MPSWDLIRERRVLFVGARRFEIEPPTLGAVVQFLRLFSVEVVTAAQACAQSPAGREKWASAGVPSLLAICSDRRRWRRILPLFCHSDGEPAEWPLAVIVSEAHDLIDVPRCIAALQPNLAAAMASEGSASAATDTDPTRELTAAVLKLSEAFHVEPQAIMDWSFEAFLTVCDSLSKTVEPSPDAEFYRPSQDLPSDVAHVVVERPEA